MITTGITIALIVNGFIMNPAYQFFLTRIKQNEPPFNCVLCLSFWIGLITGLILTYTTGGLIMLATPLVASFIAVALNRWFESLPIRIK